MTSVRKILVLVDFSEESAEGLRYAVSLAQNTEAELVVLHVTQKKEAYSFLDSMAVMEGLPVPSCPNGVPVDQLLREKALDLYHFIDRVVRSPGRLKITRKVALGNQTEKLLQLVKEEGIDLVVLPVRKRSFFSYLMARAKLLKLISRCPCPVLLKPIVDEPWPQTVGWSAYAR